MLSNTCKTLLNESEFFYTQLRYDLFGVTCAVANILLSSRNSRLRVQSPVAITFLILNLGPRIIKHVARSNGHVSTMIIICEVIVFIITFVSCRNVVNRLLWLDYYQVLFYPFHYQIFHSRMQFLLWNYRLCEL